VVTKQAELSLRVLDMFVHHNIRDKRYWPDTYNEKSIHDKKCVGDKKSNNNNYWKSNGEERIIADYTRL
jgi:hypothetical protein